MSSNEDPKAESQLLGYMKKDLEESSDFEQSNKFPQNFQPLNSESFNNINIENKNEKETEPNYEDFLSSNFSKINLGNSNSNTSQKKMNQIIFSQIQ